MSNTFYEVDGELLEDCAGLEVSADTVYMVENDEGGYDIIKPCKPRPNLAKTDAECFAGKCIGNPNLEPRKPFTTWDEYFKEWGM